MERVEYHTMPALKDIYLEDSYVLGIVESHTELRFLLDIVLTEEHSDYQPPMNEEQYCFRMGELIFKDIDTIRWIRRTIQAFQDADSQIDYGNIDVLYYEDGMYHVEGDWGAVEIAAGSVIVHMP
jgi:hypothetical protein